MIASFEKGPPILFRAFLSRGGIEKVTLSVSKRFDWIIEGDNPSLGFQLETWLKAYASCESLFPPCPVSFSQSPPFSTNVWKALLEIPFGSWTSYGRLALSLGCPGGARAVGQACKANPFPLLVPCHRVLTKGGKIGGYSQGLSLKRALLEFEHVKLAHFSL